MTQWMQFITFRPNVVMISSQGDVNIIRKQESLESVNKNEAVPNHLKEFEL
jgi:diaminopimelate decarboxylase